MQMFNKMHLLSLVVLLSTVFSTQTLNANVSYYTAGVVEFRPEVAGMNSSELLATHLKAYLAILDSPEALDTDIIVFPEGTLNNALQLTYVPADHENIIPCLDSSDKFADFLKQLSCAARRLRKYLLINLTEKSNCLSALEDPRPCASNGLNIFNTNVVFDREGRVISRYRKVHVYVENKNTTYEPEFAIFETDFGVRFGHFICFDMLFYTPGMDLVERFGVTDLIFTSLFYSELPFLTAVQLQYGWAWGNNVNLLAAGASYPEYGMTGSGIYAGKLGDLVSVMVSDNGERKLYKAKVPKKEFTLQNIPLASRNKPAQNITKLKLLKDPQIENYNSLIINLKETNNLKTKLCQGDLCCAFELIAKIIDTDLETNFTYRIGVYDGSRTYEKDERSDIKVCALYACHNEDVATCGLALTADNVLFKKLIIKGEFIKANKLMIMPSMIDDQLYPLSYDKVEWSKQEKSDFYEVQLKLMKEQSHIMTFGIYGNYYEKASAGVNLKQGYTAVILIIILWLLKVFIKFQ